MQARLRLAALDNNHHIERQQATTRNGELRFKLQYSKPAGTYIAKPIKVAKTYDFHTELLCGVVQRFYAKKKTVHQQPAASIETNSTVTTGCCTLLSAQQCHVTILTFPPHCSHKLQPLAHTVYGPFKRYYNNAADSWMLNHAGVNMVIYDLAQLVGSAFKSAMTPGNIVAGFRVSGIYPFNADIFGDCQVTRITGLVVHYNHIL